ncbi:RelA/SpoT domain-containing protein [Mannheimia bovis]|uniref:RelA/SpoT domain-containing protein n=1 Tax=Mannheimia bovis TaxID=2770636 RepID=UPI0024B77F18|nr:RelA/SpoT domain-containing protein [Mannheimia bovis]WHP48047.1 RelA/SpoT domain-containing protein [Mannheimia bovis]
MSDINIQTEFNENIQKGEADKESPPFLLPKKKAVTKAGETLREYCNDPNISINEPAVIEAITTLENYRAVHNHYLSIFKRVLQRKINRIALGDRCIVSARSKRFISIVEKLLRFPKMQLARMNDLAGIRVILQDMDDLNAFIQDDRSICELNKGYFHYTEKFHNYIQSPKSDGYRSIHQIFEEPKYQLKIELQIRTQLQHEWAMVVETLGSIKKTGYKIGQGDERTKLFLKLCSALFSHLEHSPTISEFSTYSFEEICDEIRKLDSDLGIIDILKSVNAIDIQNDTEAAYYLLILDIENHKTEAIPFKKGEHFKANQLYTAYEQTFKEKEATTNVVLVSVDDVNKLKDAYPSYFLDTSNFINRIERILSSEV